MLSNPLHLVKSTLVLICLIFYVFNPDYCGYRYTEGSHEYWDLKFILERLTICFALQALCITDSRLLRFVSVVAISYVLSDVLTLTFNHTKEQKETRTICDYIVIFGTVLFTLINYQVQSKLYLFSKKK